jgi:hypothetical protein
MQHKLAGAVIALALCLAGCGGGTQNAAHTENAAHPQQEALPTRAIHTQSDFIKVANAICSKVFADTLVRDKSTASAPDAFARHVYNFSHGLVSSMSEIVPPAQLRGIFNNYTKTLAGLEAYAREVRHDNRIATAQLLARGKRMSNFADTLGLRYCD